MKNYLLIISCSQRKVETSEPLPALKRYDGPTYRTLRKAMHEGRIPKNLDVLIISAKYGLIGCQKSIDAYDERMTSVQAAKHRHVSKYRLKVLLEIRHYNQVFINLGKTYRQTLDGFHWGLLSTLEASGGIGQKTSQMKAWLERIADDYD